MHGCTATFICKFLSILHNCSSYSYFRSKYVSLIVTLYCSVWVFKCLSNQSPKRTETCFLFSHVKLSAQMKLAKHFSMRVFVIASDTQGKLRMYHTRCAAFPRLYAVHQSIAAIWFHLKPFHSLHFEKYQQLCKEHKCVSEKSQKPGSLLPLNERYTGTNYFIQAH